MLTCEVLLSILFPRVGGEKLFSLVERIVQEVERYSTELVNDNARKKREETTRFQEAVEDLVPISAWVYKYRRYIQGFPRLLVLLPILFVALIVALVHNHVPILTSPLRALTAFTLMGSLLLAITWLDMKRHLRTPIELRVDNCKECNGDKETASGLCRECFEKHLKGIAERVATLQEADRKAKIAGVEGQLFLNLQSYRNNMSSHLEVGVSKALARLVGEKWTYQKVLAKGEFQVMAYTTKLSEVRFQLPQKLIELMANEGSTKLVELQIPHELQFNYYGSSQWRLLMDIHIGYLETSLMIYKGETFI